MRKNKVKQIKLYRDETGTEAFNGVKKFQKDRLLDIQPFNVDVATTNILEELLELNGYNVPKDNRALLRNRFNEFMAKCVEDTISTKNTKNSEFLVEDALCDIQVFAIGELMKLGQSPELALLETSKEINSRVGHIVDGKFQKSITLENMKNWYTADYNKSKIQGE